MHSPPKNYCRLSHDLFTNWTNFSMSNQNVPNKPIDKWIFQTFIDLSIMVNITMYFSLSLLLSLFEIVNSFTFLFFRIFFTPNHPEAWSHRESSRFYCHRVCWCATVDFCGREEIFLINENGKHFFLFQKRGERDGEKLWKIIQLSRMHITDPTEKHWNQHFLHQSCLFWHTFRSR